MTTAKVRVQNQVAFFEDVIGGDINNIIAAGITNLGYYTLVMDDRGRRYSAGVSGEHLREFHPWPHEDDWSNYLAAVRKDMYANLEAYE